MSANKYSDQWDNHLEEAGDNLIKCWSDRLKLIKKKLSQSEKKLLKRTINEVNMNQSIKKIQSKALLDGLYIPSLTESDGDCLFESFELSGLSDDKIEFRKQIAYLFFLFGDLIIVEAYGRTLKETFYDFNTIDYVYSDDTNLLYKYTYYTMCSDMSASGNWSRLPTELILTVISIFFKVRITIYNDNDHSYVHKICPDNLIPESDIYLGKISEQHYIPLKPINMDDVNNISVILYDKYINKFKIWANKKTLQINNALDKL
jgi:hypothetical protein